MGKEDFKSYQARQGLQYVQEKPKFIQDFMKQTGLTTPNEQTKPVADMDDPYFDDEMPLMVDSDGNVLSDFPTPLSNRQANQRAVDDNDEDLAFIEESIKEFEHEAFDPEEITQQPTSKRKKLTPPLAVRSTPKMTMQNKSLLSFTIEDEEE